MSLKKDIEKARQLLKKTVANGCSESEADSAKNIAIKILAKHNLTIKDIPHEATSPHVREHRSNSQAQDIRRQAEELADLLRRYTSSTYTSTSTSTSTSKTRFRCPSCRTEYTADTNKMPVIFTMTCKRCHVLFTINKHGRNGYHRSIADDIRQVQDDIRKAQQEAEDSLRRAKTEECLRRAKVNTAETMRKAREEAEKREAQRQAESDKRNREAAWIAIFFWIILIFWTVLLTFYYLGTILLT